MVIKVISVIGYSGSGKTNFITLAIKLLKKNLNYNVAVIKNVKHHPIDEEGKDSYKFTEAGASYSVIRNVDNETAIFFKEEDKKLESIQNWLKSGPYKIDLLLTEGFRNLNHPTVLCVSNLNEIEEQLTENVKIISGVICSKDFNEKRIINLPIIDLEYTFPRFLKIFNLI
ncbi:MAG: molybdopterin-guanine dinucleotide biosynthesis protein B [Promethearchaeota archaeon]